MSLIFVDVEAGFDSPCPNIGETGMTEFGAVEFKTKQWFHGKPNMVITNENGVAIVNQFDEPDCLAYPVTTKWDLVMHTFKLWLTNFDGYPIFVSDNPAYDWQWINYWFWKTCGGNPFGHSARRIGDYYAGLVGDFRAASKWKKLRITKHTHMPVDDAMGNVEAFERILKGER
jgi:hypothetical protein